MNWKQISKLPAYISMKRGFALNVRGHSQSKYREQVWVRFRTTIARIHAEARRKNVLFETLLTKYEELRTYNASSYYAKLGLSGDYLYIPPNHLRRKVGLSWVRQQRTGNLRSRLMVAQIREMQKPKPSRWKPEKRASARMTRKYKRSL